ncbi:putative Beta-lactamase [Candidatus Terasakiella magnetica]|nr:putative Beta-lactamase [Candidatus Terasakiella magnetica]
MHETGEGGQALDMGQALWWYRLAASHGYAPAAFRAGLLLEKGQGGPVDATAAVVYYRQAADNGVAAAQVNLGHLLEQGFGVRRDPTEAARWYRLAADQGSAAGQFNLAILLERGLGIARDVVAAASLYRKAADQGFAPAEANLGYMLEHGQGITANEAEARSWYRRAAEQGNSAGSFNYGLMLESGKGGTRDRSAGEKWIRSAAQSGLSAASLKVALIDMERMPPKQPPPAKGAGTGQRPSSPIGRQPNRPPQPAKSAPQRPVPAPGPPLERSPAATGNDTGQFAELQDTRQFAAERLSRPDATPPEVSGSSEGKTLTPFPSKRPPEDFTEQQPPLSPEVTILAPQLPTVPGLGTEEPRQPAKSETETRPIEERLAMLPPVIEPPVSTLGEPELRPEGAVPPTVSDCTKFRSHGDFQWPARGLVLSGYGAQSLGRFNDGLNMELAEGSTFCAVADGEIVYVGNQILAYGNLILVRHKDGWASVYGHVREFRVSRGDRVHRGQILGIAGNSGLAHTTQLHFEIRHRTVAHDPISILGQ